MTLSTTVGIMSVLSPLLGVGGSPQPLVLTWLLPTAPLPPPYHLQEVEVYIVGNQACDWRYKNASLDSLDRVIKDDMLCAGRQGQNFCHVRLEPILPPLSPLGLAALVLWGAGEHSLSPASPHRETPGAPWSADELHLVPGGGSELGQRLWSSQPPWGVCPCQELRVGDLSLCSQVPWVLDGACMMEGTPNLSF